LITFNNLPVFLTASIVLLLIPGPAVLYIIARSLDQGRLGGFISVLGIEVGNFCLVIAAVLGFAALLLSSAAAFSVVKYLGAIYLGYLGVSKILAADQSRPVQSVERQELRRIFTQGVVVAFLNPKTALFFAAFLPQFVNRTNGAPAIQMLVLGSIFVLMAIVTDSLYSLAAGTLGGWAKSRSSLLSSGRYFSGLVYLGLGFYTAFSHLK
jgi:threonine/homoserine/homoserine lactone efflux protein